MGCVTVRYRSSGDVELEWEGNMLNDGIADAIMAVLISVESSPAAVKRITPLSSSPGGKTNIQRRVVE
jgi:cleavage and polyadenylation specificity factor subunit 3